MNKPKTLWSKADKFLTLTRKIIVNTFDISVLIAF